MDTIQSICRFLSFYLPVLLVVEMTKPIEEKSVIACFSLAFLLGMSTIIGWARRDT